MEQKGPQGREGKAASQNAGSKSAQQSPTNKPQRQDQLDTWSIILMMGIAILPFMIFCYYVVVASLQHDVDVSSNLSQSAIMAEPGITVNGIPYSTRAHWMRVANQALVDLVSPCPFAAFGTAIVNHTNTGGLGELVCVGANNNSQTGNPTLHGEIAAINNCTFILTDPNGPYKLSPSAAQSAFEDLSLYTTAESCPMCASAIRWAGIRENIYGTSIDTLIEKGWGQIRIKSVNVFRESFDLPTKSRLVGDVLTNETDPMFAWQYDPKALCPKGCRRVDGLCEAL